MNDRDKLNCIFDYLEAFEEDLWTAFLNGSEVTRPFINAKQSVIDEIIDYIECVTGERVRISNEYLYEG
jgi:hypothetical protein